MTTYDRSGSDSIIDEQTIITSNTQQQQQPSLMDNNDASPSNIVDAISPSQELKESNMEKCIKETSSSNNSITLSENLNTNRNDESSFKENKSSSSKSLSSVASNNISSTSSYIKSSNNSCKELVNENNNDSNSSNNSINISSNSLNKLSKILLRNKTNLDENDLNDSIIIKMSEIESILNRDNGGNIIFSDDDSVEKIPGIDSDNRLTASSIKSINNMCHNLVTNNNQKVVHIRNNKLLLENKELREKVRLLNEKLAHHQTSSKSLEGLKKKLPPLKSLNGKSRNND